MAVAAPLMHPQAEPEPSSRDGSLSNYLILKVLLAGSTGLEPAASGVTGRRSSQLNYDPIRQINEIAQLLL